MLQARCISVEYNSVMAKTYTFWQKSTLLIQLMTEISYPANFKVTSSFVFYVIILPNDTYSITYDNYSYKIIAAGIGERMWKEVKIKMSLIQWSKQKKNVLTHNRKSELICDHLWLYGDRTHFLNRLLRFSRVLMALGSEHI